MVVVFADASLAMPLESTHHAFVLSRRGTETTQSVVELAQVATEPPPEALCAAVSCAATRESAKTLPDVVQLTPVLGPKLELLSSKYSAACERRLERFAFTATSPLLSRAPFREASTTEVKIPIIAITTRSSISVNPFLYCIIFSFLIKNGLFVFIQYSTFYVTKRNPALLLQIGLDTVRCKICFLTKLGGCPHAHRER